MDVVIITVLSVLALPVIGGLGYLLYYCFSLPLRRQEEVRFFLDLVESGLKQGKSVEHTIEGATTSGDRSLGAAFEMLGGHLRRGMGLVAALKFASKLLPPPITAMLKAGQELGDLGKVMAACRDYLKDSVAQMWKAQHYLVLLAFVVTPAWFIVFQVLYVFVMPKLDQIFMDMSEGSALPASLLFDLLRRHGPAFMLTQLLLVLVFYGAAFLYLGGPAVTEWLAKHTGLADVLAFHTPWKRKRMQRDFSAVLAALLDGGVPESQAVILAAEAAGNAVFRARAAQVVAELSHGTHLLEAVQRLDDSGEFKWRLANVARIGQGFSAALSGWHEALDAKAFRQEQTAAQVLTTSMVLVNGVFVGLLCVSVFQMLIHIIEVAPLW
jgi:general secretion pathway protein F